MYQPAEITFIDPRHFDGNPYEIAVLSLSQCEGILRIYQKALDAAFLMTRNAHMERNLAENRPPAGDGFTLSPQGRKFIALENATADALRSLKVLKAAAAYDPKHPPKG